MTIEQELTDLYELELKAKKVGVVFTALELEHLNTLIDLGAQSRKSGLIKEAKKQKRRLNEWERHLIRLDKALWTKIRDAEKLAFKGIKKEAKCATLEDCETCPKWPCPDSP